MTTSRNAGFPRRAFTLIELLIVVAIIAILAAIAVPNFLEAQTRSKIARAKGDMRSLGTALQSYAVDYGTYPDERNEYGRYYVQYIVLLSTPVAYITSTLLVDPFSTIDYHNQPDFKGTYSYLTYKDAWQKGFYPDWERNGCVLASFGPDRLDSGIQHLPYLYNHPDMAFVNAFYSVPAPGWVYTIYDATNGTRSWGDIGRCIGDLSCPESPNG
ncbi:MAG TPA: prepilin-type N-terminal cleavage/methylation domain-containing protein [Sumerlaeia bacterium]|nr:prepilin-type N-terminal cleavage/methylation domain-containing protein [Sumerlaeia bacterium]